MTSGVDGPWVLCRAVHTGVVIVIMKSDYDHWSKIRDSLEFIAEGKRELMKTFQKLIRL